MTAGKNDEMQSRDSYWRMMKTGRFRAFRNLPVGWLLQVLHSTDRTERWIRIGAEALLIACFWFTLRIIGISESSTVRILLVFVVVHSATWFFWGNFWVYMLDSFQWVKNPGLNGVLNYIDFVRRNFMKSDSCNAILIYGSMCRGEFHGRSDLDLRVIRRPGLSAALRSIFLGFAVRVPGSVSRIPVDLQVVDSIEFLNKQMHSDEHPILIYLRPGFEIENSSLTYDQLLSNPNQVLRDKAAQGSFM